MASRRLVPQRGRMWLRVRLRYWEVVASATSMESNQVTVHSARVSFPASGSRKVPRRWSASISSALAWAAFLEVNPGIEPWVLSSFQ